MNDISRGRYYALFVLIFLIALVGRVWIWEDQARASWVQSGDQDEYYRGAIHLYLQGDYYDEGQWLRPPVDSIYLAGSFFLFGVNIPAALLLETAVSLLNIALVTSLTLQIFKRRTYALASGIAAALFLPWWVYAGSLLSENLFTLFLALALNFLVRTRSATSYRNLFLGGIALGLATLTRPLLLYAIPLLMLWVWWERRKLLAALRPALILFIGFLLILGPWTARNYLVYHQIVLVDTTGGVSFWFGTLLDPDESSLQQHWNETLPNAALRQQAAIAQGLENIRADPLRWVARMPQKLNATFQLDTRKFSNNSALGATIWTDSVPYALLSDIEYILLVVCALIGIVIAKPSQRDPILLGVIPIMLLVNLLSVGNARYRVPLMIVPMVYAAPVLASPRAALRMVGQIPRLRQGFLAVSLVAFFVLIYSAGLAPFLTSQFWVAASHLGISDATTRAVAADPDNVYSYLADGDARLARGDAAGALASYSQAADLFPPQTNAQAKRIALLRTQNPPALTEIQAAAAAVAAKDWDNSQWYEWAWANVPFYPSDLSDMSVPAVGVMRGVYRAQTEGERSYRWTLRDAAFRLGHPNATKLVLTLRADAPKSVEVFVDGALQQSLDVTPNWQTYEIMLQQPTDAETVIELIAPTTVPSVTDPYPRALAISDAHLEE